MTIAEALAAVSGALKVVNELRAIDAQFDKAELKAKLADVMSQLADAKIGLIEAEERARDLDNEINRLLNSIRKKDAETVEIKGYHYRKGDDGKPAGSPYCPICLDEGAFVLMHEIYASGRPTVCPKCKANFGSLNKYHG